MQNPNAAFHAFARRPVSQRMLTIVPVVIAIHLVALWALVNGLVPKFTIDKTPLDIETTLIPVEHPKPHPQPPKPPVATLHPRTVTAVPPLVNTTPPTDTTSIVTTPPTNDSIADSAATGATDTHTTPPYPPLAHRLGQEGTVQLRISISATGDVTNVEIVQSSGVPELDQTAADWVKAHWRYNPAIQGGVAVASTTMAAVNFNLRNAR